MSNTIKESELAALAPDKTIAKLRALDNAGASISITPAQAATAIATPLATPLAPILAPIIAPLLGLDHTHADNPTNLLFRLCAIIGVVRRDHDYESQSARFLGFSLQVL